MTMKDKLASYNHLIETFVIVTETFLCGLLFLLFSKLSNEMQWDSLQVGGTTVLQVMLTLMLCYALCAIHSGIVLHRRKVHSLQIWKRVFENMFLFVLLGGLVLSVGNYADIASLFMLEYLFLLFLCLEFINVLLGDMSIVGPRPHMLLHTQEYSRLINKYMVRHFVKPGITGWSQVTGFRGETKELKDMEGRIRGDIWYLEHWSFGLDLYIMYRTVANVFRGEKNAY